MNGVLSFVRDDDLAPAQLVDVLDWDEAENRLHAQKALLVRLLEWS